MFNLLSLLQQPPARPNMTGNLLMIVAFLAIFYFLLIRPQRKMRQQHESMVSALKKGDDVMTDGGIIGQIVHVADDRLTIRTAQDTRIVVARNKINRVMPSEGASEPRKAT